jgi:hypothetical protein
MASAIVQLLHENAINEIKGNDDVAAAVATDCFLFTIHNLLDRLDISD